MAVKGIEVIAVAVAAVVGVLIVCGGPLSWIDWKPEVDPQPKPARGTGSTSAASREAGKNATKGANVLTASVLLAIPSVELAVFVADWRPALV